MTKILNSQIDQCQSMIANVIEILPCMSSKMNAIPTSSQKQILPSCCTDTTHCFTICARTHRLCAPSRRCIRAITTLVPSLASHAHDTPLECVLATLCAPRSIRPGPNGRLYRNCLDCCGASFAHTACVRPRPDGRLNRNCQDLREPKAFEIHWEINGF